MPLEPSPFGREERAAKLSESGSAAFLMGAIDALKGKVADAAESKSVRADWNAYPAYTLAELKKMVTTASGDSKAKIQKEIEDREAGRSVHRPTPQVDWKDVKIRR